MVRIGRCARVGGVGVIAGCMGLVLVAGLAGARKGPIKKLTFDPKAEQVELFQAIEDGQIEAKVIARSSKEANVFFENKTKKPLTIKMPKAVVAVQVLKQGGFGQGLGAGGNQAAGGNQNGQQGGGGQPMGMGGMMGGMGGMGGMGMMGGGMGMMGGMGMWSVPAEKVVQIPMKGVCLEHGKAEPSVRMNYRLKPLEEYTDDKALQEMVTLFATTDVDQGAAQAAIWNLANKMSWNDLTNKVIPQVGVPDEPYFTPDQIQAAQQLVVTANGRAEKREAEERAKKPAPRTTRVRSQSGTRS